MARANGALEHWNPLEIGAFDLGPVWVALLGICPEPTGVFKLSLALLTEKVGKMQVNGKEPKRDWIVAELQRLESSNHLSRYSGDLVWLKDRWSYNKYRTVPSNRVAAEDYLLRFPRVLEDFVLFDPTYDVRNSRSGSTSSSQSSRGSSRPDIKNQNKNQKEDNPPSPLRGNPSPPAPGKGASRSVKDESPELIAQAEQLHKIILAGIEKLNIPHGKLVLEANKTARVLRLLRSEDKFPTSCLPQLLQWSIDDGGWHDERGEWIPYIRVLMSPDQWRNKNRAGTDTKINTARAKWQDRGRGPAQASQTPKTRDELDVERRLLREQEEAAKSPEQRAEEQRKLNELLGRGAKA